MEKFYSSTMGTMMQQVQKRTARKLFYKGEEIYLCPCNMQFDCAWQSPLAISYKVHMSPFDQLCNDFEHYSCDSVRGRYVRFYVKCK